MGEGEIMGRAKVNFCVVPLQRDPQILLKFTHLGSVAGTFPAKATCFPWTRLWGF